METKAKMLEDIHITSTINHSGENFFFNENLNEKNSQIARIQDEIIQIRPKNVINLNFKNSNNYDFPQENVCLKQEVKIIEKYSFLEILSKF